MEYSTFGTLETKLKQAMGMQNENFITDQEWKDYFNEAVDQCEAVIHSMYEDYFLKRTLIPLVNGTKEYPLPLDIFANKLRALIYSDGSNIYPIKRHGIRTNKFVELELNDLTTYLEYEYILINNDSSTGVQIKVIPTPANENNTNIICWYIRNATKYSSASDVCDIPEFSDYILQFVRVRAYEKEKSNLLPIAVTALVAFSKNMENTLSNMVPDGDTTIALDLAHYEESN